MFFFVAVFYPIKWLGLRLWRRKLSETEEPSLIGLGWQGIVPAKTKKMSTAMVNATLTQLIRMEEIVQRLDPYTVADILLPQTPSIMGPLVKDLLYYSKDLNFMMTEGMRDWAIEMARTPGSLQQRLSRRFLVAVTQDVQREVDKLLNLQNCVLNQTMADRYENRHAAHGHR